MPTYKPAFVVVPLMLTAGVLAAAIIGGSYELSHQPPRLANPVSLSTPGPVFSPVLSVQPTPPVATTARPSFVPIPVAPPVAVSPQPTPAPTLIPSPVPTATPVPTPTPAPNPTAGLENLVTYAIPGSGTLTLHVGQSVAFDFSQLAQQSVTAQFDQGVFSLESAASFNPSTLSTTPETLKAVAVADASQVKFIIRPYCKPGLPCPAFARLETVSVRVTQ